jgi:hypothetical protein
VGRSLSKCSFSACSGVALGVEARLCRNPTIASDRVGRLSWTPSCPNSYVESLATNLLRGIAPTEESEESKRRWPLQPLEKRTRTRTIEAWRYTHPRVKPSGTAPSGLIPVGELAQGKPAPADRLPTPTGANELLHTHWHRQGHGHGHRND